jgi:hypothetical protein
MSSVLLLSVVSLALARPVAAQQTDEEEEQPSRFTLQFGPLALVPAFGVTDFGHDTNVFYDAADPKADWTATPRTRVGYELSLNRAKLTGDGDVSYVYFHRYTGLRSFNRQVSARLDVPIGVLTPYVADSYLNARQRPNFEIDQRVRRFENTFRIGTKVNFSDATSIDVEARRTEVTYDKSDQFRGFRLAESLNHRVEGILLAARHAVTPLTTFALEADARRDEFELDAGRTADAFRVAPVVEFKPLAAIAGRLMVGYRRFVPSSNAPEFAGACAEGDLSTEIGGTRLQGTIERDVGYSFDPAVPYYIQTNVGADIVRAVSESWQILGGARWTSLAYEVGGALPASRDRRDTFTSVSAGAGYVLPNGMRLTLEVQRTARSSERGATSEFEGYRVVTGIRYGY